MPSNEFMAPPALEGAPLPQSSRGSRVFRELIETILLTVIIFFVVRLAVQNFRVDGTSMMSTVRNNDLVLVNKVDYLLSSPQTGDVIVFKPPVEKSEDFIKRVIGTPGDVVQVRANQGVWLNGKKLNEPYLQSSGCPNAPPTKPWECEIPNYNWGPATVPQGDYFVLGDDRNDSYDSHAWCPVPGDIHPCDVTWVPRSAIIGKALIAYWPVTDFKFFGF